VAAIVTRVFTFAPNAVRILAVTAALVLASGISDASQPPRDPDGLALVGHLNGPIGPATGIYVERLLADAKNQSASCLLLTLDTPGGLSDTMREIIQGIFASPVPVVTFVYPEGARSASAGALIALSAHVSAMAPGTNMGAAHPVTVGPGAGENKDDVMTEKVTNDAAASARSIAHRRGRNVDWAERVVRESISSTAEEALTAHVIDVIARDPADLLKRIDGRHVDLNGSDHVLAVAHATLTEDPPTWRERFLATISEPNIAYLLMLAGIFGIFFELQHPGAILPGVVGALSIITAGFAFHMLPVNAAGFALIVLALALFVLEVKVTSHGLLAVGGCAAMLIGSMMLIDSPLPFMRVSLGLIIPSVIATALFFLFVVSMAVRARHRRVTTGREGLLGLEGVARGSVGPDGGSVFVRGEFWNAESAEAIEDGAHIRVEHVDGLTLRVRRASH
jgi:membrane-bound serine protease (ClpP class)